MTSVILSCVFSIFFNYGSHNLCCLEENNWDWWPDHTEESASSNLNERGYHTPCIQVYMRGKGNGSGHFLVLQNHSQVRYLWSGRLQKQDSGRRQLLEHCQGLDSAWLHIGLLPLGSQPDQTLAFFRNCFAQWQDHDLTCLFLLRMYTLKKSKPETKK